MSQMKICNESAVSILLTGWLDWMGSQSDARRIYKPHAMESKLNRLQRIIIHMAAYTFFRPHDQARISSARRRNRPFVSIFQALIKYDEMLSSRAPGSQCCYIYKRDIPFSEEQLHFNALYHLQSELKPPI